MEDYRALTAVPARVRAALAVAEAHGFAGSCLPEVGRLLATLAAGVRTGVIGEIGAGCGVGTAWLASTLAPGARLVTVERDAARAAVVADLCADLPGVRVLHADWRALLAHGPFDLLFADAPAKREEPDAILGALRIGGMLVLDDLTPIEHWPPEWRGRRDELREYWLNDPRLVATELRTAVRTAAILATRIG